MVLLAWTAFLRPAAAADNPQVVNVWPGKAPDEICDVGPETWRLSPKRDAQHSEITEHRRILTGVTNPTLTIYRPARARDTGASVLICPGGGYWDLYWETQGEEIAHWLNSVGVTGIILKFRVPRQPDEVQTEPARRPLQDAQRAISLVRSKSGEWRLNPQRVGIMGFSAGGHLAVAAAIGYEKRTYAPMDDVDKISCRPDFAVAVYPGYLKLKNKNEIVPGMAIPFGTPPVFFAHGDADLEADPENSVLMYLALHRAGIPTELHIYAETTHSFGVRPTDKSFSTWTTSCVAWLRYQGLLNPPVNP